MYAGIEGFITESIDMEATRRLHMLNWSLTFFVIAIIAALLGFGGIAGSATEITQILFFVFIVLFIVSMVARAMGGKSPCA
jgi:uncharacterized membrane protein YtjA (UPF0391 family)